LIFRDTAEKEVSKRFPGTTSSASSKKAVWLCCLKMAPRAASTNWWGAQPRSRRNLESEAEAAVAAGQRKRADARPARGAALELARARPRRKARARLDGSAPARELPSAGARRLQPHRVLLNLRGRRVLPEPALARRDLAAAAPRQHARARAARVEARATPQPAQKRRRLAARAASGKCKARAVVAAARVKQLDYFAVRGFCSGPLAFAAGRIAMLGAETGAGASNHCLICGSTSRVAFSPTFTKSAARAKSS